MNGDHCCGQAVSDGNACGDVSFYYIPPPVGETFISFGLTNTGTPPSLVFSVFMEMKNSSYILDADGCIKAVVASWATGRKADGPTAINANVNYISLCD